MKSLYIMRHAKSSWKDRSLSDFERPLNKRGRRTAPLMGEIMVERGYLPDTIFSSPAARAVETYQLIADAVGFKGEVEHQRSIYEASLNALLTVLSSANETTSELLMTGHNPGFEMLVQHLAGEYHRMPTAALAVFEIDSSWAELSNEKSRLVEVIIPKEVLLK